MPGITLEIAEEDLQEMEQLTRKNLNIQCSMLIPYPRSSYSSNPEELGIRIEDRTWSQYYQRGYPLYSILRPYPQSREQLFSIYLSVLDRLTTAVTKHFKPLFGTELEFGILI